MTPIEKWKLLQKEASKYPKYLRYGQCLMNALQKIDLPIYTRIAGTNADCFYDDEKSADFAIMVMDLWYGTE